MKITARGLNRATLGRQMLLVRESLPIAGCGAPRGRAAGAGAGLALPGAVEPARRLRPGRPRRGLRRRRSGQGHADADHPARGPRRRTTGFSARRWTRRCAPPGSTSASGPPVSRPPTPTHIIPDLLASRSSKRGPRRRWRPGSSSGLARRCIRASLAGVSADTRRCCTRRPGDRGRSGPATRTSRRASAAGAGRPRGVRGGAADAGRALPGGIRAGVGGGRGAVRPRAAGAGQGGGAGTFPATWSDWRDRTARRCSTSPARRARTRRRPAPPRLLGMWDSILLAY